MPKIKTRKVAAKRFKADRDGKLVHRVQGARHLRRKSSAASAGRIAKLHWNAMVRHVRIYVPKKSKETNL